MITTTLSLANRETFKTITLGAEFPIFTILRGHQNVYTFNAAFERENYKRKTWRDADLSHEYWIENEDGTWSPSTKFDPNSVPVTVGDW